MLERSIATRDRREDMARSLWPSRAQANRAVCGHHRHEHRDTARKGVFQSLGRPWPTPPAEPRQINPGNPAPRHGNAPGSHLRTERDACGLSATTRRHGHRTTDRASTRYRNDQSRIQPCWRQNVRRKPSTGGSMTACGGLGKRRGVTRDAGSGIGGFRPCRNPDASGHDAPDRHPCRDNASTRPIRRDGIHSFAAIGL